MEKLHIITGSSVNKTRKGPGSVNRIPRNVISRFEEICGKVEVDYDPDNVRHETVKALRLQRWR